MSKRALIVDDSKSARFALKRMLNKLTLDVDTVESASDALDYLEQHQPDVIFMDHMMPGMDGFEAVKRIKNNPQTVVIPILMYTSRAGDLYLSQARALGAVGIIPKTIAPVELKESLLELGLIEDLPEPSSLKVETKVQPKPSKSPEQTQAMQQKKKNVLDLYIQDLRKLMDDQTIELHRSMWLGIESVSNEIFNRLNSELDEKLNKITQDNSADIENNNHHSIGNNKHLYTLYILLFFTTITIITLYINSNSSIKNNNTIPDNQNTKISNVQTEIYKNEFINNKSTYLESKDNRLIRWGFIKWAIKKPIPVPYNEQAFNDERLPIIKQIVNKAIRENYKGLIILKYYTGNFCLKSDNNGDYKLSDPLTSLSDCEYTGPAPQAMSDITNQQSLGFANYISDTKLHFDSGIQIELEMAIDQEHIIEYPSQNPETSVEAWNHIAQLNNRIVILLDPLDP